MPIYEITAPDGKTYEIEGPPGASRQDVIKAIIARNPMAVQTTAELEAEKSAPMSFGDTFKAMGSGVFGAGKSFVDFFGTGTDLAKGLGEARSYLQQSLTPERQAEITRRQELEDRAARSGSLFQEAKAYLGGVAEAPFQSLAQAAGSSTPGIVAGLLTLPASAPAALALGVATISKLAVGAIQGEGERKGSVFDVVKAEYMKQGKSEQEAENLAIKSSEFSRETALQTGGAMLLGALDAFTGVEPAVAKALRRAAPTGELTKEAIDAGIGALRKEPSKAPTRTGQFVKSVATEAPLEGAQGSFGQYAENVALQQAGADVSPMQGVLGAGLRDAAVGALFGGTTSPLSMKSARQEYETEQFLRQAKVEQDRQREAEAALKRAQEERARVEEGLGVPKMLALPAPNKPYEEPKNPLVDPVGRVTEDELGKAIGDNTVVNYINKYRKENNLPKLKSYSIEDIKDAMTAQNPEGEEGALNAILAYKTNYQNETYTPENILESALAKNIATETKGWTDFLNRATGKTDLNTMSQPQLHSVSNALEELRKTGRTGTEAQLVLPEGSNATRFTQDQYNSGVTAALLNTSKEKPVTYDEALKRVQTQKGVDSDQSAERLLRAAASNDDLIIEKGTGFQATSKTGTVLGTYATKEEAQRNHRRAYINPVETELVMPRIEEATRPETELPEGYQIKKEDTVGSEAPAFYVVREEGSQKDQSRMWANESQAKESLPQIARLREAKAVAQGVAIDRIRQRLEKQQEAIFKMEADGETGTVNHKNAVNAYEAAVVVADEAIAKHADTADALRTPLKIVPIGKKSTKAAKHTVIKEGKVVASFDTNDKAQAHVLSILNDKDLGSIVKRGGTMGQRAKVELDMRERPGVRGGTTAGLEKAGVRTPEVEAKLKELEKKLRPMLNKFGLGDVGLNVVRAIENDADGAWGGLNNLIRIAFNADKPIKTMRHEALHALFDLGFFTPQQWEALKREAKKTWVDKYLKNVPFNETMSRFDAYTEMGLSDEAILEEAIADAFGDWEGGAKPPPGMMAALFKRMQQFFSALRQALTGAGFESADEIFGKIERGELKAKAPAQSKMNSKMSLRQADYNKDANRLEVSTARPTALRPLPGEIAPRDPIKDFYVIDSEDIMSVPSHMASAHNAISAYNWFPVSEDPNATVRAMKDTIVDNLVWLYNLTPENIRNRAKLWYNGANRIAKDWSKSYGYTTRQMAGVLAVLSPQKDWFMNTSLGERVVHVYTQRQNDKWSSDMTAWAESYVKASRDIDTRDKRQVILDAAKRLEGTKLKDMNLEDMAYFVRVFDETYHSRKYRVITPEGMFGDYVTVNEEVGEDQDEAGGQGDVAWGTYDSIKKAISILQDGSHENISEQLGDEHKVRNFNNNIVDPDSASGSVTIDTHAVAAASFKALSGASLEVLHNFGTTPKGLVSAGGSAMTGASGTYGFIADAYREAAAMVGVLPREMQSITWEAIRSIFPAAWKSQNASSVNAIYDRFKSGEITLKQARDEVLKISGGIKKFAWENDKSGVYPSAGATSFDVTKQEPRVLQPYQIREKLKINLSAAPSTDKGAEVIPGIQYLFGKARNNDMAAYTLLQEVASDSARHLLGGIENVKITSVPASGLFFDQFEPSVNLAVAFDYGDKAAVLPALKRFASNFKQKQIHVRQVSKLDVETEYDDGSYNTPVFTFKLEESFSRDEIQQIVRASGLPGITFTENQVVAYFMRGKKSETAEEFYGQIEKLAEQLGGFASAIDATVERLWVYGSGYGATQGYASIKGDVRPGAGVTVQTAKRVAAYLNNVRDNKIKTFENADITDEQASKQNVIGDMYDKLPVDDMGRPIVRKAYEALAPALLEQYKALPINVSWSKKKNKKGQPIDAYGSDSAEMRKDILNNNRLQILPTTPESFGPEGYDFSDHPLLQETGLTLEGRPLLYNDLLRAVHDYYAHGMTEVGFGPKGEEAAWKNHISITKDPLARWALTMETRAQNSYVNFRSGLDRNKVPLKKRGFAEQKAALLPVQVALTGNASVDAPMKEFIKTLSKDEKLGSAGDIKLAPGQKLSLRTPDTKEFKQWFGDSKVVDANGKPLVVHHMTKKKGITEFSPKYKTELSSMGFHFGTKEQAKFRGTQYDFKGESPNIGDYYLSIKNPLEVSHMASFAPDHLADQMMDMGILTDRQYENLQKNRGYDTLPLAEDLVKALKRYGYDGLVYENEREGEGKSYVPFDSNQIKSATDNVGSYSAASKDVRFSLREAPDTPEFKRFFAGSKVVNEDGSPKVMYHGTRKDFSKFKAGLIFAAPNPMVANKFAANDMLYSPDKPGIEPGANVMPVYIKADNPFDYENPEHVDALFDKIKNLFDKSSREAGKRAISQGRFTLIEDERFVDAIKELGHDGLYVEEFGEKNLAVFEPNQVKSATGNLGTFDATNADIRYSLRTYFPTAEKAEQAAYKKAAPSTPEFKRFFGASKVKEEGRPQVMYHGSLNDFTQFNEDSRKGLIFVTPSPAFAEEYALLHASRMEKQAEPPVKVYPLWVRAETPFDYENPVHVDRVMNEFGGTMGMNEYMQTEKEVKEGNWSKIEDPRFVATLKRLGFDSLYVKENRTKNLAVFSANQVKSVTGNIGEFGENKDIRYSLRNSAFHSGDLGYGGDTALGRIDGSRGTGHFGTGVYLVSGIEKLGLDNRFSERADRPIHQVDLSPYKLAEPLTNYHAELLHDGLRVVNGLVGNKRGSREEIQEYLNEATRKIKSGLSLKESDPQIKKIILDAVKTAKRNKTDEVIYTSKYLDSASTMVIKGLGFDGIDVRRLDKFDNTKYGTVVYRESLPAADATPQKYSLPAQSAAYAARRDETTTRRENKGVIDSILESFAPESMANLRAAFIHRYNQLGVIDKMLAEKMGGKVLLADVSAEAAANMSDLSSSVTYSAFGIGNRKGGIPVYKNGATTIDNSVKGPLEILAPLAQFNDPVAYQDYQYWAGVQRGKRFMAETGPDGTVSYREKNFSPGDIALVEESRKKFLAKGVDFRVIQKEMNTFNDGVVNYMVATGVVSAEDGAKFKKHMDYIPFFRQVNGDTTVGPKIFNSISGVKPPKKLKGSEAPLTDYLESIVRNTQAAINAGMKNVAAQRAVNVAMQLGPKVGAQRLNVIDNAPDTVQVMENGKQVSYRVADQLFINAVKNLNMSEMPFLGFLSGPANLLRNLVTKDPGFMLANMARDSLSAWTTSGVNITPIASTAANFAKALGGKSATYNALLNGGILGGYEFSTGLLNSANVLEADLNKKYGSKGMAAPLGVFKGVWDALEKGTEASDAATRMAVYDRVLEETGNETEALYRALEVMNFNRKGSSPVARILTAAIPFLNARIQGLDVLYRTAFGKNVTANNEAMQKAFFVRGMTLMALSAAYFLAVSDDEEWKKQEQETKDNYWIFPGVGKFPTPFEVGFLFKTVPERIMAYYLKDDTGQDLMNSMRRGLLNTFAFNPIPQVAKPLVEYAANYNFFTGRPIVGQGLEGREVQYQVGPTTTHSMEWLGKQLGLSPIKLEQVYGGYTGTMGMYALTLFDSILNTQAESPNASKRFEQLPVFKRFAADPEARGNITQFYELKRSVDAAVETQNYLLRAGSPKEFEEFMERNAGLLASKQYVASIEKTMKGMREMRKMVDGAQMTADEKSETLIAIGQAENDMTQNIQTVKKMISEL